MTHNRAERLLRPGERIAAYKAAYRAANGKDIEVVLKNGWFLVGKWPEQSKWRGKKLDECTATLRARSSGDAK